MSITYNHEAYIRDALDSFVAQKTDFPVEYIIADDASTDGTPAIIQEYSDLYPHLFRPILRRENVGIYANWISAMSAARGEYLALCEGDDYWIDPMKLAKQVAFLDQHPATTVCFHPVRLVWEDGFRKDSGKFPPVYTRGKLSIETLILMNFIQTNSVMYRRLSHYDDIPDVMPLDWYLHLRHAACGDIAMLPDAMAVYRRHPQAEWYSYSSDRAKFWATRGPGHVAMSDALLDVFPDQPLREELIVLMGDSFMKEISKVPGPEGRAVLQRTIAQHPRLAMLALQYRWKPIRRLQTAWRTLAAVAPSRRGLADFRPGLLLRPTGKS